MNTIKLENQETVPSKIVCVGRNYVGHIKELDNEIPSEPVIFLKPNSAISHSINFDPTDEIHYEGEITFLVQSGKLHAVGFGLDLTKRKVQAGLKKAGLPWQRSKAFDGSAVFSDFVPIHGSSYNLGMELIINGESRQKADCELMLFKPLRLLEEIKSFISLEDGDLIMTGTPEGVGKMVQGDKYRGKIFQDEKLIVQGTWQIK